VANLKRNHSPGVGNGVGVVSAMRTSPTISSKNDNCYTAVLCETERTLYGILILIYGNSKPSTISSEVKTIQIQEGPGRSYAGNYSQILRPGSAIYFMK